VSHPIDTLDLLDHHVEDLDFEPMDTVALTCVECDAPLEDDDLILGAFCGDCRPFCNRPITGHSGRGHLQPGVEYVPSHVRRRYAT
jgi:hypothetical protein